MGALGQANGLDTMTNVVCALSVRLAALKAASRSFGPVLSWSGGLVMDRCRFGWCLPLP